MARYIDAEKLVEKIKRCSAFKNMKGFWYESELLQSVVLDLIDNLPTADVVEVVRCKECKHRNTYEEFNRNIQEMVECHCCEILKRDFGEDFFCGHGERR